MNKTIPHLNIIQWNARSLYRAKLDLFKNNLRSSNPSIVLLSETHWVDSHPAAFDAYNCFVKNRTDKNGGGVAILVKKSISASLILSPVLAHIECIGVSILLPDGKNLVLISAYCPKGDAEPSEIASLLDQSNNLCVIGGDFNAHHRAWENTRANNRCGLSIVQYLSSNSNMVLCTPPNLPTRIDPSTNHCSTIDLTFATPDLAHLTQISLGPTTWDSDHVPIRISLNMKMDFISDLPST